VATTTTTTQEWRGPVLDVLRELLAEGREREVLAIFEKLVARNEQLEQHLAQMQAARGRKNEGISIAQLRLFLDALAQPANAEMAADTDAAETELDDANAKLRDASGIDERADENTTNPPQPPPRRGKNRPLAPNAPRQDNPIRIPDADRPCPKCGKERVCIGHDVTETIELVPAQVIVRRDRREKIACEDCEGELVRAPVGDKIVASGRFGSTLVAHLLVDKYWDGLALHRMKARYARMGLFVSVSTLADQVKWATELLCPLWRLAIASVLAARVMHLDATSLPVLDRNAPGNKKLGALWGYVGDQDCAAYVYTSTAKKLAQKPGEIGPEDMLRRRSGFTVADASNLFDASFRREDLIECGCNMHARRYYVKALDRGDPRAALPIAAYKKLYEIEDELRDLDEAAKLAERQARSKPVFDELVSWCRTYQPHEPPSSPLGTAIQYQLNHQEALGRFLEHGVVPIDNGIVERLHVRAALTRKNYLHAGSDSGGERAAIAYTILSCCRLAGVNPVEYLTDVLPRLARKIRLMDLPALMPAQWRATRAAPAPA
jgi:transposase